MYDHILVPVDFDHAEMTKQAHQVAQRLMAEGGKVTVLHVRSDIPGFVATEIPGEVIRVNEGRVADHLEKATKGFGDAAMGALVHGNPGRAILDYADANDVDCIIVASHKPGLQDYFLGSTAARVVRHAQCCVHVMR